MRYRQKQMLGNFGSEDLGCRLVGGCGVRVCSCCLRSGISGTMQADASSEPKLLFNVEDNLV